ncbi:MAG: Amuc_1100 family pilus-like protein [Kiritimatiellae bacterium]|nr:Amuc_1100 family pilus-like protein [Kiritimatiellia bacterium]
MKIRSFLPLIVAGGVSAVLAVGLVVWVAGAVVRHRQVAHELETARAELRRLASRVPFPSPENVERAATNQARIEAFFDAAIAEFLKRTHTPPAIEPARFPILLQRAIAAMNLAAVSNNVSVPDRFMYGFDRYARGQLPNKEDIPRLARQIHAVETITRAIFSAKIREIVSIERHVFEEEVRAAEGVVSRTEEPIEARGRLAGAAAGYAEDPEGLFVRERLIYEFRAKENTLWAVLDLLPTLPVFCVISDVDVWNDAPRPVPYNPADGTRRVAEGVTGAGVGELPADEAALLGGVPGRGPPRPPVPAAPTTVPAPAVGALRRPLKHEERTVAGMTETLRVRMQVDFYSFRRPGASAGEAKP